MKKTFILLAIVSSLIAISSCCKEGTGGDATLVVFLKHHGSVIKNHVNYPDTVYFKFNAKESPGNDLSKYDTYVVGEVGEDHVHCPNFKCGDYYILGTGIDSAGPYRVLGGMHIKIKHKERKNEIDVDLAVVE